MSAPYRYSYARRSQDVFFNTVVPGLPKHCKVLEAGGLKARKRGRFNIDKFGFKITYANISPDRQPDVLCSITDMPFDDSSFDAVVCGSVLEHIENPDTAVTEMFRVLRPGGTFIAWVPFLFRVHGDPNDYTRYTRYKWASVLKATGFSSFDIYNYGGAWTLLVDILRDISKSWKSKNERRQTETCLKAIAPYILTSTRFLKSPDLLDTLKKVAIKCDRMSGEYLASYAIGYGLKAVK